MSVWKMLQQAKEAAIQRRQYLTLKHIACFCGEKCIMDFDKKNPNRWRRVLLCRTADRVDRTTFKQTILDVIDSRQVKIRLMGAISDLHAADARFFFFV